jgi:hypothetical protein
MLNAVIASAAKQSHPNGAAEQVRLLRCARKESRSRLNSIPLLPHSTLRKQPKRRTFVGKMPRPLPHRLLSALLALLVLATSVGLTAERHRCRISGRSSITLSLPGLTQPDDAKTDAGKPGRPCGKRRTNGCCDVSHAHHKLNAQSADHGVANWLPDAPHFLPPALLPAPVWAGLPGGAPLAAVAIGTAANSSPPGVPRAGRVLLTLVCTLVV